MIIVLKSGISDAEIDAVCRRIEEMGYRPHPIRGEFKTVIGAVGEERGQAGSAHPRGHGDGRVGDADPAALQAGEPRDPRRSPAWCG